MTNKRKLSAILILVLAALVALVFFWQFENRAEVINYYLALIVWLIIVWILKLGSETNLKIDLALFLIAAILYLMNFLSESETLFRISYIGLLISVPQAFFEYLKHR